ncbi:MAG TPA: DEAD/DEAH box helicase [Spirochaetota bacterium]|nr:DEAD/DEAH box helicase [Spirochaetota bacterium]
MPFQVPGLSGDLCRAADELGYRELFPVQGEAIPVILAGKDLAVSAQTGSGKTAAFLLPILQRLTENKCIQKSSVRVLVLVPTRELAVQVAESAEIFSRYLPGKIRVAAVHGGVSINPQVQSLAGGADILVATPGRLIDIAGSNGVKLSHVEILVLDEADRMLDLGFKDEVGIILKMLPEKRQNLLFSATLGTNLKSAGIDFLDGAVKIGIEKSAAPAEPVEQIVYTVDRNNKGILLRYLINDGGWEQVLVFVSSKRKADNVARKLNVNHISSEAMHGDKSQGARTGALARFRQGKIRVLVATDLASRGLDIEQLPYVVNYELPRSAADYIHRIGRTGRAGIKGIAVTLLCEDEFQHMRLIEKRMDRKPVYIDSANITFKQ